MINKKKKISFLKYFMIVFILLSNCSKKESFSTEKIVVNPTQINCNLSPCATMDINLIRTFDLEKGKKINTAIEKHVIEILNPEEKESTETVEEAMIAFNTMFTIMKSQFPEELFTYEATVDCNVNYQSPDLLTVEIDYYLFTGGAHGYEGVSFIHFDPQTGEELTAKKLFKNINKVAKLCERTFRTTQKIPSASSINSTGFDFENDKFYLPENIGFEKDSLLLYYNSYEINPYASGSTLLKIPLSEIKDQLTVNIEEE